MKILERFFKPKPVVVITEEDFDEMKYDNEGGWDSEFSFNDSLIEIGVAADIDGPTENQKRIWREVKDNIQQLNETSTSIIKKEMKDNWPAEFWGREISLFGIDIYADKHHKESEFIMLYSIENDFDGIHRVDYKELKPLYYGRDD